ncbi:MAG: FtsX-like permease family protein [Treponema sp.]|nr:FtsX-like permease family protein [Treponema sp.]
MKTRASLLFASRLIFPRTGKKSNARKSLVGACACIGISLIPLVMVLSVSNGMIQGITSRMIGLSSSDISCILSSQTEEASSLDALSVLAERIAGVEGVVRTYPQLECVSLASSAKGRTGATVRAVESTLFERNPAYASLFQVEEGVPDLSEARSAIVGKKLAEMLDLHAGSTFRLITTRQGAGGKTLPKLTPFKVSAVVSSGYQELDALWVFIPLETGFSILSTATAETKICVETRDAFSPELPVIKHRVEALLPASSHAKLWSELNTAQYENFSSTQIMLLFIMLLILLVASVNISSALVMLVMERRREIAILKSLGASNGGITISFLVTGMVAGGIGVLTGLPLGLLCAVNINKIISFIEKVVNLFARFVYLLRTGGGGDFTAVHLLDPAFYLQNIPLSLPLTQLVIISVGTLVLSLAVSALPAIKAGREKPIDTLRKL